MTKPVATFRRLLENNEKQYFNCIVILTFLSLFNHILHFNFSESTNFFWFVLTSIFEIFLAFFSWIIFVGSFSLLAKIFYDNSKFLQLATVSVYSLVPLILMGPFEILKTIFSFGYFLGVVLEIFTCLWVIVLFVKSLSLIYNFSFSRAFLLIFLPILYSFFGFFLAIDFFIKLGYIFKV